MDVVIDGARNFALRGAPEDLFAVVAAVSDHLGEQGRTIMRLDVDGVEIAPNTMAEKLEGKPLDSAREMCFKSEEMAHLVDACLAELRESLPDLPEACRQLAQVFQGENPEEGYEPFRELAEIWLHVNEREMHVFSALGLSAEDLEVDGRKASALYRELNGFLEEAAQALQDGDTVLLGDLLEYELAPRAEVEVAIVDELQKRSRAKAG